MKILALDVATHCGWAISNKVFGVWDLSSKRDESSGMRLIRMKAKMLEIHEVERLDVVVFERPGGTHRGALIVQAELQGVIKAFCEETKIQYRAYSASEIKKFATGKGNAKKSAMIASAKEKYGYVGNDDNEADALHLLNLAQYDLKIEVNKRGEHT